MKAIAIAFFLITPVALAHNTCDIQNGTAWHKDERHDGTLCHGHIRANSSSWWNYGANGKVAGIWGVNENVGDCDSNNEDNNDNPHSQTQQEIQEEVIVLRHSENPDNGGSGETLITSTNGDEVNVNPNNRGSGDTPGTTPQTDEAAQASQTRTVTAVNTGTPQPTRRTVVPTVGSTNSKHVLVTEYMVLDFCQWDPDLPQWIELYNNSSAPVSLQGWVVRVFWKELSNSPKQQQDITIPEGYTIAPKDIVLLVTKLARPQWTTVEADKVFNLGTENVLKFGWIIFDSEGTVVNETEYPHKPSHIPKWHRVSYERYPNAETYEHFDDFTHYYGHDQEYSTAGYHAFMRGAAPSLIQPQKATMWGTLKSQ